MKRKQIEGYWGIQDLLRKNLSKKEDPETLKLIRKLRIAKKRGYFTKREFVKMGMWKSPRPKKKYLSNSEKDIISLSKKVFATKYEKRIVYLLTILRGVDIPVASAILTLTNPKNYGVIDKRCWKILYKYDAVKSNPNGQNFSFKEWYVYLTKLRYYAKKLHVSPRDIDRTLYNYSQKVQKGNLYE